MAVYKGQISLININDGAPGIPGAPGTPGAPGMGIQSSKVYYITSLNGMAPPDLEGLELITDSGDLLNFSGVGATFQIKNGKLYVAQEGSEVGLTLEADYIIGTEGWSDELIETPAGQYLWSKTIFTYTDTSKTIIYNYSRSGANGTTYQISTNQEEILKFNQDGRYQFSPGILEIKITKDNEDFGNEIIGDLDYSKIQLDVYYSGWGSWYELSKKLIVEGSEVSILEYSNNVFTYNLNRAKDYYIYGSNAETLLTQEEVTLRISYELEIEGAVYNLQKFITCRYAMNEDMASLSLNANDIVASIQSSKLRFSSDGLEVENGGFQIIDKDYSVAYITENDYAAGKYYTLYNGKYELSYAGYVPGTTYYTAEEKKVLYADGAGNLVLAGNLEAAKGTFAGTLQGVDGTFSGELRAASGTFSGNLVGANGDFSGIITALKGSIGGFDIIDGKMVSQSVNNFGALITLDGTNGKIIAENIELGTGAKIKDYIRLGDNVELISPTDSNSNFIVVKKANIPIMKFDSLGKITIGDENNQIIADGANGKIYTKGYSDDINQGWSISKDTSVFNNVTIRGAIEASVIKYGAVQAIGGMMIVRPSTRITSVDESKKEVVLESVDGFNEKDWCLIQKNYYQISKINGNVLTFNEKVNTNWIGQPIVDFGNTGNTVGIGINGSVDRSLIQPQSISVFDFNTDFRTLDTKIILGQIPRTENKTYGALEGTYGLYAENVLLKGSLVTEFGGAGEPVYSGISTMFDATSAPKSDSQYFEKPDYILMWAGAKNLNNISEAPFYVDRAGNLLAKNAYLKGTLITDAQIEASELKTTTITGWSGSNEAALTIKNASRGISFLSSEGEIFSLGEKEIKASISKIDFNNVIITDKQEFFIQKPENNSGILIFDNTISYAEEDGRGNYQQQASIKIEEDKIGLYGSQSQGMVLESNKTSFQTDVYFSDEISYQDFMKYIPVTNENNVLIGYDLYIG